MWVADVPSKSGICVAHALLSANLMYSQRGAKAHPAGKLISDGGCPGIALRRSEPVAEIRGTDPHYSMYIRNDTRSIDWDIAYRCANLKDRSSKDQHVRKWRRHTEVSEAYKIDMSAWVSTINNVISFISIFNSYQSNS